MTERRRTPPVEPAAITRLPPGVKVELPEAHFKRLIARSQTFPELTSGFKAAARVMLSRFEAALFDGPQGKPSPLLIPVDESGRVPDIYAWGAVRDCTSRPEDVRENFALIAQHDWPVFAEAIDEMADVFTAGTKNGDGIRRLIKESCPQSFATMFGSAAQRLTFVLSADEFDEIRNAAVDGFSEGLAALGQESAANPLAALEWTRAQDGGVSYRRGKRACCYNFMLREDASRCGTCPIPVRDVRSKPAAAPAAARNAGLAS